VRLYTRNGHDWAERFPGIVAAARALKAIRFLIDGEVMVAGPDGRAVFELLRRGRQIKPAAFLCAFDLIMVAGDDLRSQAIEGIARRSLPICSSGQGRGCSSTSTSRARTARPSLPTPANLGVRE
jgi:hypothetical protein